MVKREISVIILNDKNQILLQKRSENKRSYPNMWALCTGHVEENESFKEAAIRELKEELGVNIKFDELYSLADGKFDIYEENFITKFYIINCNLNEKNFIIQKEELSSIKWYDIDKIINMIKNNNNTIVYKKNRIILFEYLLSDKR